MSIGAGTLPAMESAQLDRVLAADYVGDVTALAMEDLRAKRAECQALEVALSYQRRMAQGRLDIVAAERRRRAEGGDPPSHDDLIRNLARLMEASDADLEHLVEGISAYEHEVSARRRQLHERIDALQAELTRRYRTGEATVDALLRDAN